ncbi:flavodoxin family protein [Brevibacterium ihuae]|uniref:flavodoxin family protein n=1 Tax=Brevibacterium ihuae TaxID=1631743 RepID=UPI000C75AC13|nr:NAD(P)H-dependent oxidoreductase [Brevibacterium ihuae]
MSTVLLVHHSPTPATEALAEAARAGLSMPELEGVEFVEKQALEATSEDLLAADAIVLGTTANFGYISGALKHFFDSTYTATREQTAGRPFSYWIHGGYDTTGAERAMESITTGYGWEKVCTPVVFTGEVTEEHTAALTEMAATVAATTLA